MEKTHIWKWKHRKNGKFAKVIIDSVVEMRGFYSEEEFFSFPTCLNHAVKKWGKIFHPPQNYPRNFSGIFESAMNFSLFVYQQNVINMEKVRDFIFYQQIE